MAKNNIRAITWILIGSCILSVVLAFNAGQKRKAAVSRSDDLDAKLAEIGLRYENAVQSYQILEKNLKEAKDGLRQQELFGEALKATLLQEQKKSSAMKKELDKIKAAS